MGLHDDELTVIAPSGRHRNGTMLACEVISLRNEVIRTSVRSVFAYILAIMRIEADGGGIHFHLIKLGCHEGTNE